MGLYGKCPSLATYQHILIPLQHCRVTFQYSKWARDFLLVWESNVLFSLVKCHKAKGRITYRLGVALFCFGFLISHISNVGSLSAVGFYAKNFMGFDWNSFLQFLPCRRLFISWTRDHLSIEHLPLCWTGIVWLFFHPFFFFNIPGQRWVYMCMSKYLGKLGVGRTQSSALHGEMLCLFSVAFLLEANKLLVNWVLFLLSTTPPSVEGAEETYLNGFWFCFGHLRETIVFLPLWDSSHCCRSSFFHSIPVFILTFAWPEEGEEGKEERPTYPESI